MYKGASQGAQKHLSRLTTHDALQSGDAKISMQDQLVNMRSALANLEELIVREPIGSPLRRKLGRQKMLLSQQKAALLKKYNGDKVSADYTLVLKHYRALISGALGGGREREILERAKDLAAEEMGRSRSDVMF